MDVQTKVPDPARLTAIRTRLETELLRSTPPQETVVSSDEPRPGCTNHMADCASDAEVRYTADALRSVLLRTADQVRHALRKLDAGTYGICDSCGEAIEEERLEIIIYAASCCKCIKSAAAKRH
ncbi:MAG TPA: conjugal transfer protein TraR [Patescibacteria group bacterium]|nr:conjugal transfer protein TraR [Patescibacteria group bacterium]